MKINYKYLITFIALFIIEALIAIYVHDKIVRPYIGDILVVILMYTLIRAFVQKQIRFLSLYLFIFATMVEIMQYFHLVKLLHLQSNRIATVILGSSFDIKDILCYLVGSIILILWEKI